MIIFKINISVPSILLKFSDQKTGSRRVVGWHKKSEKYFGFILAAKPRLRWVPEVYVVKIYFCMKRKFLKKEFWLKNYAYRPPNDLNFQYISLEVSKLKI